MFSIALPKGRLADKTSKLLFNLGYIGETPADNRKLVFCDAERGVRYFLVKPSDVAIYVEYGVADIGVVGKDVLVEERPDVYELLDLKFGKCRMCVAAAEGYKPDMSRPVKVATKFVNTALAYFESVNRESEIIKLNGSVELAPLLGISDVIVDLVETGTTLKENNLKIIAEIMKVSARLIANKSAYKFKTREIDALAAALSVAVSAEK
ncbi:MAG TPA: ATP phosphoribosyltransferase [Eubacteriales bacterium]|jgi:ATP phosphoribosyltransferase|nr:ATP phosphoribosyltransferase [Clostridia bacterium]HRR89178.1 ATP phosphoribosyltransferase [Eubacteriales bacterium]HRU83814.1 ATP phosphoribosyltransferase [Eubacteriales bacterium]